MSKIILHLCAKEGSDSKPYADAGYDVRIIGEDIGVENYTPPPNVYGIIANPPCTQFSVARTQGHDLQEGMRLVKECLRIIWQCQTKTKWSGDWSSPLKFWIIENPSTGFLKWFLGNPVFTYCQSEYGASFTKKTALWGFFNLPKKPILYAPLVSGRSLGNLKDGGGHGDDRSRCPIDFAKAFFEANP